MHFKVLFLSVAGQQWPCELFRHHFYKLGVTQYPVMRRIVLIDRLSINKHYTMIKWQ